MSESEVVQERKIVISSIRNKPFFVELDLRLAYGEIDGSHDPFMNGIFWKNIKRDDPILVSVVEKFPDSGLKVVSIPGDVKWRIETFEGIEHVEEVNRVWF